MVRSRTDATRPATALRGVTASSACAAVLLLLLLPPAADAFVDVVVVAGAAVPSSSGWWALDRHATLPPSASVPMRDMKRAPTRTHRWRHALQQAPRRRRLCVGTKCKQG